MLNFFNESSTVRQTVRQIGLVVLLLLTYLGSISVVEANESAEPAISKHIVYLVRHAEKLKKDKDPALTQCGLQRANALATQLGMVNFTNVFSTQYQRTQQTAKPIADQNKLTIRYYDPRKLELFAQQIRAEEGVSLIVGHSNTTAVLAGLLAQQGLTSFDESIYDRLYQVVIINGHANLQLLMQNFECNANQTQ